MVLATYALPAILLALAITWIFARLRRSTRDPAEDRAALAEADARITAIEADAEAPRGSRDG